MGSSMGWVVGMEHIVKMRSALLSMRAWRRDIDDVVKCMDAYMRQTQSRSDE